LGKPGRGVPASHRLPGQLLVGIESRFRIAAVRALWGKLPDPREQHLCVKETVALHAFGCIDLGNGKQQSEKARRALLKLPLVRVSSSLDCEGC
jgi:hypothetical protein